MGFACEDELNRPLGVVQDTRQPIRIAEQEGGPFVGGEAAGEAYREHAGVEDFLGAFNLVFRSPDALQLSLQPAACHRHEAFAAAHVGAPQLFGGDGLDAAPDLRVAGYLPPAQPEIAVVEVREVEGDPGAR